MHSETSCFFSSFQKRICCANGHVSHAANSRKRWGGKVTCTLIPASEKISILGYQHFYDVSYCNFSLACSKPLGLFFHKSHIWKKQTLPINFTMCMSLLMSLHFPCIISTCQLYLFHLSYSDLPFQLSLVVCWVLLLFCFVLTIMCFGIME